MLISEVIICTETSGLLAKQKNQNQALSRGQGQGNVKGQKGRDFNQVAIWFGILAATMLFGLSFVSLPKAHAADRSWGNIDTAKKAIENVAPVISDSKVDQTSASYVFSSDEFIQKPLVAETQVTVQVPVKKKTTVVKSVAKKVQAATPVDTSSLSESAHRFPYGYCTYYVSQQRFIPWSGNAITWLTGARSYGFATGHTPQVGAIIVTAEGGRAGHVGMIDGVNGDQITITEMNYHGYGVISTRTIPASTSGILGYIY